MTRNISDNDKTQFYMQICAALIRRCGGSCVVSFKEFEQKADSIANRSAPDNSGIELRVIELGEEEPKDIPFQ